MKQIFLISFILLVHISILGADTYIKIESHVDAFYTGGIPYPAEDFTIEIWLGENKMSRMTNNRLTVIDLNDSVMYITNLEDSTYVKAALPFDLSRYIPEQLAYVLTRKIQGAVKETSDTQTIKTWNCRGYDVNFYVLVQEVRYNETDMRVWATPDVSFDLNVYDRLNTELEKLQNFDEQIVAALKKIEGFRVLTESITYLKGFGVPSYEKMVEISEKQPPDGIYSIPDHFTEKEKLSRDDLQNR